MMANDDDSISPPHPPPPPWWSTEGLEACRIFGIAKPMSSSVRVSSFMKYGNWNTQHTHIHTHTRKSKMG